MSGQVQRVEADCKPMLRTASYDPLSSSWPREQMRSPNPVSVKYHWNEIISTRSLHSYFSKSSKCGMMLYNNHSVRVLPFGALKCVQSRAPFPAVPHTLRSSGLILSPLKRASTPEDAACKLNCSTEGKLSHSTAQKQQEREDSWHSRKAKMSLE